MILRTKIYRNNLVSILILKGTEQRTNVCFFIVNEQQENKLNRVR